MRLLAFIGVLFILAIAAGAVFLFGGFYNVAASDADNPAVAWAVSTVREISINNQARSVPRPPNLDDAAMVQAGAREFVEERCVVCHGAPGVDGAKFYEGMNPQPPYLDKAGDELSSGEIFWVIKNGIKMTGMPAFGKWVKDDEAWKLVAFIRKFKSVTPENFKTWTAEKPPANPPAPTPPAPPAPNPPQP